MGAAPAAAQVVCDHDADGQPMCRYIDGAPPALPATPHEDAFGNLTLREPDGDVVHGQTDAFGTTTFRPPPESYRSETLEAFPDGLGGVVLREPSGALHHPMGDGLGNVTVRTESGAVRRCHVDPVGVVSCD